MSQIFDPEGLIETLQSLPSGVKYYSLPVLEEKLELPINRLPVSIRIVLESLMRNCDGRRVCEEDIKRLAAWNAKSPSTEEVPFLVARVILQDFTGVPLLVDLAAMRDAVRDQGGQLGLIEPEVPVDLVIDHSVQVDRAGTADAFQHNLGIEFNRNQERYEFLKWGQQAFGAFKVVPPGIGIVHQVNLEYLATLVAKKDINGETVVFFDTLVGTDSHTTMINGLGVVGWGVGGIEAEAAMLGQPVAIQTPEVVGFNLMGVMKDGLTATDLTLKITEILRQHHVVGKFIEFYGEGVETLSLADRATIANMAPEYGATMGFFPIDEKTLDYMRLTGRSNEMIHEVRDYLKAQKMFGIPSKGAIDYTMDLDLDLDTLEPCVSGPRKPQECIYLKDLKKKFTTLIDSSVQDGGFSVGEGQQAIKVNVRSEEKASDTVLSHGSVVIAAITSCTNTSNPSVMLAAGLLAKKAVEKGLSVDRTIKTSLAPGSRVVTDYLDKTDLTQYLDQLGFQLVAYGCTTCIGNSGPLDAAIEGAIRENDLVAVSVLSGNRNFEARIHGNIKANFLMSPPLVIAFALAGRIDIDMDSEPLGMGSDGQPVFLKDVWPSNEEIQEAILKGVQTEMFKTRYANIASDNAMWDKVSSKVGMQYSWDEKSTYIQKPPFFEGFSLNLPERTVLKDMRPLALFGDSVTTDHISPAGAFRPDSPAGKYLTGRGIQEKDFNSYGSRRGNDQIMTRGTFANVRVRNLMAEGKEGGFTKYMPGGCGMSIYDACQEYRKNSVPLIVLAGDDYGMGSSRDWAAKGTNLLGVSVVVAQSFERIHRSNLIGMGVLPLQFSEGDSVESIGLTGEETFSIIGLEETLEPKQKAKLLICSGGQNRKVDLISRLDTSIEIDYYRHGGILQYVLRDQLARQK